jgi:predicted MFS family arabinose efflux permease
MFFLGVASAIIGAASGNIGLSPFHTGLLIAAQNAGFILAVLAAGSLADSHDKARLLGVGSLVLAASFFLFYFWRPYALNLTVMFFVGAGIGTYEGVADAMLLDLHPRRQGLFVSVNHFFVTFGCLAITLYLVFLPLADWRRSLVQSAAAVLLLALLFLLARAPAPGREAARLGARLRFLKTQSLLAVFLAAAVLGIGMETGLLGLLTGFLRELRGYDPVGAKLGLVLFLAGVAAGRALLGLIARRASLLALIVALFAAAAVISAILFGISLPPTLNGILLFLLGLTVSSLLPLLITLTGLLYKDMAGTALGIVKLGIPVGGILIPSVLSVVARYASFQASLLVFPLLALASGAMLAASRKLISARVQRVTAGEKTA